MGTCLDWQSSIVTTLPSDFLPEAKSDFALEWRQAYFDANAGRLYDGKAPEDIDNTHRKTLLEVLQKHPDIKPFFTDEEKENAVKAWHVQ